MNQLCNSEWGKVADIIVKLMHQYLPENGIQAIDHNHIEQARYQMKETYRWAGIQKLSHHLIFFQLWVLTLMLNLNFRLCGWEGFYLLRANQIYYTRRMLSGYAREKQRIEPTKSCFKKKKLTKFCQ